MRSARLLALTAAALLPVIAHAHPGHDGDHDFVWDFAHLVANPLATIACAALLGAGIWGVWRLVKMKSETKSERVKRD